MAEDLVAERTGGLDPTGLAAAAALRHADVAYLPTSGSDRGVDAALARLALTVALRRHARPAASAQGRAPGRDLSRVRTVVASGGVFRHADPARLARISSRCSPTTPGGGGCPPRRG